MNLPGGLVSGSTALTVECWATFGANGNWARLFDFGNTSGGSGQNYVFFSPHTASGGTLELAEATLATNSTVSITNGAMLQLDFSTTNQISSLVLNGVAQPAGVYNADNKSAYISGSGSLIVIPYVPGPGRFSSTPGITGFTLNGANVVLTVTNAQANDAYYLLASTNLSLPINWFCAFRNPARSIWILCRCFRRPLFTAARTGCVPT